MSKKLSFFARLLVIIMCLALVLTGCNSAGNTGTEGDKGGDSKPKTPQAQLSQSADKTIGAIMGGDSALNVLSDALDKGKITINVMGMVENVLYIDSDNGYFADFLSADIDGVELEASAYLKDSAIALAIPALLGDETYGVNLDTLVSDLKTSAIWSMMGVSYEEFESQTSVDLEAVMDVLTDTLDSVGDLEKVVEDSAKNIKVESAEGKATIYGQEVDAIIITTTLNTDDIKAMLDAYIDWMETTAKDMVADLSEAMGGVDLDSRMELSDSIDSMREELDYAFEDTDLNFVITTNINPNTSYIMSCVVDMTGTVSGEAGEAHMELVLGEDLTTSDKYTVTVSVNDSEGDEMGKVEIVLNRELGESKDVYTLNASMTEYGETYDVFSGSFTYDKESHDFELSVEADGDEIGVSGKFYCDKDSLELSIDTIESYGEEMEVDVSILIEAISASEMPDMPKYTNILKMSESDLTDLILNISELLSGESYDDYYGDYSENVDGY